MKRQLFINSMVIMIVIILMVGCGKTTTKNNENVDSSGSETTAENQESTGVAEPFGRYKEPLEFTYARSSRADQTFADKDNYDDNVWTRLIKERFNVDLKIAWSADGQSDAFQNKMNVQLASGEMPDLISGDFKFISMAYEAGLLADLTQAYEDYASPFVQQIRESNSLYFDVATIDEKLMAFPFISDPVELQSQILWIREDWLDNLGLEAPKTFDDVITIARAFTKDDPDGNGKDDTYGLGVQQKLITADFGDISGVAAAYGALTIEEGMWLKDEKGNIIYGATQPEMKEALKALQDMYNEGLLDPEFGVKDASKLEEDINQGKIGMAYGANWNSWWPYTTILSTHPEAIFKPYPIVSATSKPAKIGVPWPINTYYAISHECENPEVLIKLINLYGDTNNDYSTLETYAVYDDNNAWMLSPVAIADPHALRHSKLLKEAVEDNDGGVNLPPGPKIRYDQMMSFISDGDPAGYGLWGQIGPESSAQIILNEYIPQDRIVVTEMRGEEPEVWIEKKAILDKIQVQAFTEIIMGGDINLFDKFVEDWNNAGGAEVMEAMRAIYK